MAYMSPEQARGEPLDSRTDLFSFGAVLYEMATGRQAFTGPTAAVVFDAILHGEPVAPLRLRGALPPELERVLRKALEKDRALRYQSASELVADLRRLRRETELGAAGGRALDTPPRRRRLTWVALGAFGLVAAVAAWWGLRRGAPAAAQIGQTTVAVLPFRSLGAPTGLDHLRLGIPDEITTALSYAPALAVRPFAATSSYEPASLDPRQAGRQLRATRLVTGQFAPAGEKLRITLEAIDAQEDRLIWRESWRCPPRIRWRCASRSPTACGRGFSRRWARAAGKGAGTRPQDAAAYDLFLRSVALARDPEPNRVAAELLEKAVAIDPGYARAWAELALRLYFDAHYGAGGAESLERSGAAAARALTLDPDLVEAAIYQLYVWVERGELWSALEEAEKLVARRPQNAVVYMGRSYVLRYAGQLALSQRDCEAARSLDPTNFRWRSCNTVFFLAGDHRRARQFAALDPGSDFEGFSEIDLLLREGRMAEARAALRALPPNYRFREFLPACLEEPPPAELAELVRAGAESALAHHDPEPKYHTGARVAFCGHREEALRLLRAAVEGNYCSFPAIDQDPLWASLRRDPEFLALREQARACHQRFAAHPVVRALAKL